MCLSVVPVKVKAKGGAGPVIKTYALLDSGSEVTLCHEPELQKSHGYAGITREEGLQNGQSVRKVSCQHTT